MHRMITTDLTSDASLSQTIAQQLRQAMLDKDITQDDLAERMNVSQAIVSRWLSGKMNMTLSTLARIGEAIGCRITISADL